MKTGCEENGVAPGGLTLAVAGHRDIAPEAVAEVRGAVGRVLDALIARAGGAESLFMLNALAVGADSLVFDAACERGIPIAAVLPLPAAEYEKDFAPGAELDGFRLRLGRCREIRSPETTLPRPECYEVLGAALLRHADILLALWDGNPDGPRGGTAQIVRMAGTRGKPQVDGEGFVPGALGRREMEVIRVDTPRGERPCPLRGGM